VLLAPAPFIEARAQHAARFGAIFDLAIFRPAAETTRPPTEVRDAHSRNMSGFTDCPPAPEEQNVSKRAGLRFILMSMLIASGSNATGRAEV